MNQRQKLKKMKKQNELLHGVVYKNEEMKHLYEQLVAEYKRPLNVTTSVISFDNVKLERYFPEGLNGNLGIYENVVVDELLRGLKDRVEVRTYSGGGRVLVQASIMVPR